MAKPGQKYYTPPNAKKDYSLIDAQTLYKSLTGISSRVQILRHQSQSSPRFTGHCRVVSTSLNCFLTISRDELSFKGDGSVYLLSMKEYVALKPLEWRDDVSPWNSKESRGPLLMIGRGGVSPQNESILSFLPSMCTYATNESTPSQLQQKAKKGACICSASLSCRASRNELFN